MPAKEKKILRSLWGVGKMFSRWWKSPTNDQTIVSNTMQNNQTVFSNSMQNLSNRSLRAEQKPLVSMIIACRNERNQIEACIKSALAQQSLSDGFEVVVADGMSNDGTRGILMRLEQKDARLRIIDNPGRIVSSGLNAAIRFASGQVIARMDAHTEYSRDYVFQCLATMMETGADNVGGPARTKAQNYVQSAIAAAYHSPFAVGGARFHTVDYEGYVDTVTYGCWRREVFDRIGFFDEELVRNQDDELNLRLTRAGGKIWQSPRIKSWYTPRASLTDLWRQYMQYGYWKVRVIQKHKIPASWRHLVPGSFLFSLFLLAVLAMWWPVAGWSLTVLVLLYFCFAVGASLLTAARQSWRILPLLPLVFGCYHFSYGYGFLRGVLDFMILRRGPRQAYQPLNRASVQTR